MKRTILSVSMTAILLAFAASAMAQDAPRETTYDFDGDTVEGALLRPEGDLMAGTRHGKDSSLIDIRSDFIPEMIRSVRDL